jgi:hypothetical protein
LHFIDEIIGKATQAGATSGSAERATGKGKDD